jgi:hypothetical protein
VEAVEAVEENLEVPELIGTVVEVVDLGHVQHCCFRLFFVPQKSL